MYWGSYANSRSHVYPDRYPGDGAYSQSDRDPYAIVFRCKKYHEYCDLWTRYGQSVTTDFYEFTAEC
jgi:hypothetical protein